MADKDPKQFRPAGQNSERRSVDADEDPLIELARIVSEDSGFYSAKPERPQPQTRPKPVAEQNRDAFSADLEAELLQELEFSLRSRQAAETARAPAPPPRQAAAPEPTIRSRDVDVRPAAQATDAEEDEDLASSSVSFDEASAADPYREDPAELLRALQQQLGGLGHTVLSRSEPEPPAAPDFDDLDDSEDTAIEHQVAGDYEDEDEDPTPAYTPPPQPAANLSRPTASYQPARESYDRLIPEQAGMDDPFAATDSDSPAENPFLTPLDAEPASRSRTPVATRAQTTGAEAGWSRMSAESEQEAFAPRDQTPAWSRAPSRGEPRWMDRQNERPLAVNDDPRSGRISGWSDTDDGQVDAYRSAADQELDGSAEDLRADHDDVRHDLRTTLKDFGDSSGAEADTDGRLGGARMSEAEEFSADGGSATDFETGIDDLHAGTVGVVTPAASPRKKKRVAAAPARLSRGKLAAGIVAAVVIVGGGLAAYLHRSDDVVAGPPPVIKADNTAVKVEAQNPPPATSSQAAGDVVYNRPPAGTASPNEQIVDSAEEPKEVARVVLPPPAPTSEEGVAKPLNAPTSDAASAANESVAAQGTAGVNPVGPRKVRTVVVKPDGTIVASSDASVAAQDVAPDPVVPTTASSATPSDPLHAKSVKTMAINAPSINDAVAPGSLIAESPGVQTETAESDAASAAGTDNASATPSPAEMPRARPQRAGEQQVAAAEPAQIVTTQEAAVTATPAATPAPVAQKAAGKPIDLLAGSSAGNAPAAPVRTAAVQPAATAPAAGSGYVVQLSSQKSQAQAESTYASLKAKFPTVLGQYQPNIISADLGAKGVYYRVRVGPWASRADAIKVCEALKSVGGSCFIGQ